MRYLIKFARATSAATDQHTAFDTMGAARTNALWSTGIVGGVSLVVIVSVTWSVRYGNIRVGLAATLRKVGRLVLRWLDPTRNPARGGSAGR